MPECSPRRSEERFSRNAETDIYTLSLHDALPISEVVIADLLPQTLDPAPNIRLLRHARIIRNARMLPKARYSPTRRTGQPSFRSSPSTKEKLLPSGARPRSTEISY